MRILIVSDTHKDNRNYYTALERERPLDMVIHCGDSGGDELHLEDVAGCPFYIVAGNTDYYSSLPRELFVEVEGHRVLVTHGHKYYVNDGPDTLRAYAKGEGADIVFYGHTHVPDLDFDDDVAVVNPGSLSYPRQENRRPSYAVMEIDRRGKVHYDIVFL